MYVLIFCLLGFTEYYTLDSQKLVATILCNWISSLEHCPVHGMCSLSQKYTWNKLKKKKENEERPFHWIPHLARL